MYNLQCTGIAMVEGQTARQCCFLDQTEVQYRQPGNQILYYWKHAELQCQDKWIGRNFDACAVGWTGPDCDTCATNIGPPGQCNTCNDGWLPPTCDQICDGFGCCDPDNCQGCIQNGRWQNRIFQVIHLTFRGERSSDVVLSKWKKKSRHTGFDEYFM